MMNQENVETVNDPYAGMNQGGYGQPYIDSGRADLAQIQLDNADIIEDLKHNLKREIFKRSDDGKSGEWIKPKKIKPMLNDEGVTDVISLMNVFITKIFILSNFSEDRINDNCLDFNRVIIEKIFLKRRSYEIDKADRSTIRLILDQSYNSILRRALNAGERISLTQTHRIMQTYQENQKEKNNILSTVSRVFKR